MKKMSLVAALLMLPGLVGVLPGSAQEFEAQGRSKYKFVFPCDKKPTIRGSGRIVGTSGNDVIFGSSGPDIIDGKGGNDLICGRGGADNIDGGSGNDTIDGGSGGDNIKGGKGDDRLIGSSHGDTLSGGSGNDDLFGGRGTDTLKGGGGADGLFSQRDGGTMDGGGGKDFCDSSRGARSCEYISGARRRTSTATLSSAIAGEFRASTDAITLMERHMSIADDGTLAFDTDLFARDLEQGAGSGFDLSVFVDLRQALADTNERILAGEARAEDVFTAPDRETLEHRSTLILSGSQVGASTLSTALFAPAVVGDGRVPLAIPSSALACSGKSDLNDPWWGWEVWLNSCETSTLINLLATGAGVATVCAAFANLPCGIAAGLLGATAGTIAAIHSYGGEPGMYFAWLGYEPLGIPFKVWHQ